jgi:hypothetical protein
MPFATSQGKKSLPGTVGSTAKGAAVSGRFSPTGGGVGTPKSQERSVPGSWAAFAPGISVAADRRARPHSAITVKTRAWASLLDLGMYCARTDNLDAAEEVYLIIAA